MNVQNIDHIFNFTFEKTASEIRAAAANKIGQIQAKIEERGARIRKLRDEHKITDAVLVDIQNQMRDQAKRAFTTYTSNVRAHDGGHEQEVTVGAGVINFLLTEQDFISGEKAQVERLLLMTRNLNDVEKITSNGIKYVEKFRLSYEELKFLGF